MWGLQSHNCKDGTHGGRDHYEWFCSGIFFSIIILLVLIVIAFACLFGLIGGILLITGIIKKKRGRATKLKKVSVVFFIISAVLWIVPAVFTFCMRLYTFSMRQDYVDTGVKVQAEEGAGVFDFEWEGEKLAPLEREYFDIIYISGESKTKAVCNIEYVHEWKWLSDFLLGDPDIDTMYQVENGSGYPIYQYDRWIGCLERDREAVLDYYDNKVPLTFYYIREKKEEEEDDWEKRMICQKRMIGKKSLGRRLPLIKACRKS